jgi:hypothetical protein
MKNKQVLALLLVAGFVRPVVAMDLVPKGSVTAAGLVGAAIAANYVEKNYVRGPVADFNKTLDPITSKNLAQAGLLASGIYFGSKFACKGIRCLSSENAVIVPLGILAGVVVDKGLCKIQATVCPAAKTQQADQGNATVRVQPNIFRSGVAVLGGVALANYFYHRFVK